MKKKGSMEEEYRILFPNENVKRKMNNDNRKTRNVIFLIIIMGIVVTVLQVILGSISSSQIESISRSALGDGKKKYELLANIGDEEKGIIIVEVEEIQLSMHECETLYNDFLEKIQKIIIYENNSMEKIQSNLYLPSKVNGYPFILTWESSDNKVIDKNGTVRLENMPFSGYEVTLTLTTVYKDFEKEEKYRVNLQKSVESKEDQLIENIKNVIVANESSNRMNKEVILPKQYDGKEILWSIPNQKFPYKIIALSIGSIVLFLVGKKQNINRKIEQRVKQMNQSYPKIIAKMTLLLCAGYTLRKAWEKMVQDYKCEKTKIYAYEEMVKTYNRMKNGLSEGKAYEYFGEDCKIPKYKKWSMLLSQNLKRGTRNITELMKEEAKSAFIERKENAQEEGEKAQTKMLLPMMLLLIVVMVVIMVPAFSAI